MLTQSQLKEILTYNPDTGIFTWLVASNGRIRVGDIAGTTDNGYVRIMIERTKYRAHRLAWLYVHGESPKEQIDHINHIRDDNRINNLRCVSCHENFKNMTMQKIIRLALLVLHGFRVT